MIIDDEENILTSLEFALEDYYEVYTCPDPIKGLEMISQNDIEIVLLDLRIGEYNGISVLEKIKSKYPEVAVIILTSFGSIKSSVDAIRAGAFYYLTKPVDIEELKLLLEKVVDYQQLNQKIVHLNDQLYEKFSFAGIIGCSEAIRNVFSIIDKVKDIDTNVLLSGESGTGKELIAKAIHYQGIRKGERFEAINCAAIPGQLLESELFGFEKGAFTGAMKSKLGKLSIANRGTIFLDEIGEMDLAMQSKLLRVLQEKEITPLGSNTPQKVDIRVIAATNRQLLNEVSEGRFREDLYYRLNVISIEIPPLRKRKEDIPLLVEYFIQKYNNKMCKSIEGIDSEALQLIESYKFPGNVRELENVVQRAIALTESNKLRVIDFPRLDQINLDEDDKTFNIRIGDNLKSLEREIILKTLEVYQNNRQKAAKVLGITVRTLRNKLNEYREDGHNI